MFSLTRNADLAEEVTQQTFYEAIRHPGNYRGEAALSTYLCGIREVVYLRLSGELPFSEIGAILGESETWARVTFYRAKQKLLEGGGG